MMSKIFLNISVSSFVSRDRRDALPESRGVIWGRLGIILALWVLLLNHPSPQAHESDQYTLPVGREFADLSVHFSRLVYEAIADAVEETNESIADTLSNGEATPETVALQSPDVIAGNVWEQLFATFPTNESLDASLSRPEFRDLYPGLVTAYRAEQFIYDHPGLLVDITKLVRIGFRASTVMVDGTSFGTDKIIHFINLGRIYHNYYLDALNQEWGDERILAETVPVSVNSNPFLSENGLLGMVTTGVRSNGDLAANYAGFKFYRNLTEAVTMGKRRLPPMLVLVGHFWRIDEQVSPYSDFFTRFITPHWNEALNPNAYAAWTDTWVRKSMQARCPDLLDWYRDPQGNIRDREAFVRLSRELSSWYGEDYGYESEGEETVSIATTCFSQPDRYHRKAARPARPAGNGADQYGRTQIWWSAKAGEHERVSLLLASGADPNTPDMDGETPLHVAARWKRAGIAEKLLKQGANPDAAALYGSTPLHLSARRMYTQLTEHLLRAGANPNVQDDFGRSPLHEAAARSDLKTIALLLQYGANPHIADKNGITPRHLMEESGQDR